jgi:glutamate synthase (NADPH/NADH) small chain
VHEAWSREVVEFSADERGHLRGVVVEEVEILRVDDRREFRHVPETRTELPAELALLGAGFVGTDVPDLLTALGVAERPALGTAAVVRDLANDRTPASSRAATPRAAPAWWSGPSRRGARARRPWTATSAAWPDLPEPLAPNAAALWITASRPGGAAAAW